MGLTQLVLLPFAGRIDSLGPAVLIDIGKAIGFRIEHDFEIVVSATPKSLLYRAYNPAQQRFRFVFFLVPDFQLLEQGIETWYHGFSLGLKGND
jgi:hypothetical protein